MRELAARLAAVEHLHRGYPIADTYTPRTEETTHA